MDIVEVGPRDGFQPIATMIPTEHKMRMIESLYRAGVRRMEATAFVLPLAVPQLADAPDILTFAQSLPGLAVQILVPNLRKAESELAAGARQLSFVLSVTKKPNLNTIRRTPEGPVEEKMRKSVVKERSVSVRVDH